MPETNKKAQRDQDHGQGKEPVGHRDQHDLKQTYDTDDEDQYACPDMSFTALVAAPVFIPPSLTPCPHSIKIAHEF